MFSLYKAAQRVGGCVARQGGQEEKAAVLTYGFEVLGGFVLEVALIFFLAWLLKIFVPVVCLMVTVGIFRSLAGGEHCQAYYRCLILSLITFLLLGYLVLLLAPLLVSCKKFALGGGFAFALFATWKYAPVESPARPLSVAKRLKVRKGTFAFLGLWLLFFFAFEFPGEVATASLLGLLGQSFTLLPWGRMFLGRLDALLSFPRR